MSWLRAARRSIAREVAVCVAIEYERRRTLLLSWPLLLNPPLFESAFYRAAAARPWRTASVVGCAALFAVAAWPLHEWLLRNDAFHYWTPLLDPAASRLAAFK